MNASCRLITTALVAVAVLIVAVAPARAQSAPDVSVFAPGYFASAEMDESVRYSWFPRNSQDWYRIVFNTSRSFGWETTPYSSRETLATSLYASPRDLSLTPGIWYWRICFGWFDNPSTCYFDDDIRTLEVEEPPPYLSFADARSATREAIDEAYGARARVVRCARVNESVVLCRAEFRRRGRTRSRIVHVVARADGVYYRIRR